MQTLGKFAGLTVIAAATLVLTACSDDDGGDATTTTGGSGSSAATSQAEPVSVECVEVAGGFGTPPEITIPEGCLPPEGLFVEDLNEGTGPEATPGSDLTMDYQLVAWSTGEVVDSSFARGEPFRLTLGAGQVIPGWEQGLEGVQKGERRVLIIPSELGYGEMGSPPSIAGGETLIFVTDAVDVAPPQ